MEMRSHQVNVRIDDQRAETTVVQEFYNPNARSIEGSYVFPLPRGAQLDRFTLEINGRAVDAELLPANKAREIYEDIVRQARDPALLEYAGQDTLRIRVFPIEAHDSRRVTVRYSQMLKDDAGLREYVCPLRAEKYSSRPVAKTSVTIELNSALPIRSVYSPSHPVGVERSGNNKATLHWESANTQNPTDLALLYAVDAREVGTTLLTHRMGEEQGFFLLLASPGIGDSSHPIIPKDITFVLDTSGSMAGDKLEQARRALRFCIDNLNEQDRFEIIRFSTEVEPLFHHVKDADENNRRQAHDFVRKLKPMGGTDIDGALQQALASWETSSNRPSVIVFLTDGQPTVGTIDEFQIVRTIQSRIAPHANAPRIFCFGIGHDVNTRLLDKITDLSHAASQYVLPEEDIELKVSAFYAKIREPVLSNLKLVWPEGVRITRMHPADMGVLHRGEQGVIAGRYEGTGEGLLVLEGEANGEKARFEYRVRFPAQESDHAFIPRLWATRRIGFLLDEMQTHGQNQELRDEVTDLARQYGIVTPWTSYLILEDERRRQVPVALQSLPRIQSDPARRAAVVSAWEAGQAVSGAAAVTRARGNQALRHGMTPDQALADASTVSAPSAPGSTSSPGKAASPTCFAGGKAFYENAGQWIDSDVQKHPNAEQITISFGTAEYFALLERDARASEWLSLGLRVQFVLGDHIYSIVP